MESISSDPQNENGQNGFVQVAAYLDGDLGEVTNVNYLIANTDAGNIGSATESISCVMHPNAPSQPDSTDCRTSGVILESVTGNLFGDVIVAPAPQTGVRGTIEQLRFIGGQIGVDEENPVLITADGAIGKVQAKQIHANIRGTSMDGQDSYVHLLGSFETRNFGTGEFTGEIRAENLGASDEYDTEKVTFRGPLVFAGPMRGRIWAQDMDTALNTFHLAVQRDDFEGSISLASLDDSAGASAWGAEIGVLPASDIDANPNPNNPNHIVFTSNDSDGYTPPHTAATLGGGTVGVVPFRAHLESCTPAKPLAGGEILIDSTSERPGPGNPIRVKNYGPVIWDTSGPTPFRVERRRADGTGAWIDQTDLLNGCFQQQSLDPNDPTIVIIEATRLLQRGFEYRVSPRMVSGVTVLRSDMPHLDTASDPPVSTAAPLVFVICSETPRGAEGDATDNGVVDFADITSVLANFGYEESLKYGDADRNGTVDFADITAVLANFNMIWCTSLGQSIAGKGGGALNHLDFEADEPMSAAEAAGVVTSALASMGYASIEAFADAIAAMDEETRNAEVRRLGQLLEGTE